MSSEDPENLQSVYDFRVKDTFSHEVSQDKYRGKVLVIVNIASKCALARTNYRELTKLYEKHKDDGLLSKNPPLKLFH